MNKKQFVRIYESKIPGAIAKAINDDLSSPAYQGYRIAQTCLIGIASAVLVLWEEKD